jgi:hypothetical protein
VSFKPSYRPDAEAYFSNTYAEARALFLRSASRRGLSVASWPHPLPGSSGEALALDVARAGDATSPALLILSSGCHGVEGFCGSAVQSALLDDEDFHRAAERSGVALLYLHALNPWGFSHFHRVTHENVDLNRNFPDFTKPLPRNTGYDSLAHLLVPAVWPPPSEAEAALSEYARTHGVRAYQQVVTSGQYHHSDGLHYGGVAPTWSHLTLRRVLAAEAGLCNRLGWIDIHTGLGEKGHGEKIMADREDADSLRRARSWWGDVTSIHDGTSSSALLNGLMWNAAREEAPQAKYTGIALEFGTLPFEQVLRAIRAEQWLHRNPSALPSTAAAISQLVLNAFLVRDPLWAQQVVAQSAKAARDAVKGLST